METEFTRVGLALLLERVSTCRAGTSGTARTAVLLTCIAGAGSGTGSGAAPPAIKMAFGGEFPEGEEGVSPYIRTRGARREPQKWKVRRTIKKCKGVIRNESKIYGTAAAG